MLIFESMGFRYLLQILFFVSFAILGLVLDEPNTNQTNELIAVSAVVFVSFLLLAFLLLRDWNANQRRLWVYFAVAILVLGAVSSPIIMHFDTPEEMSIGSIIMIWGTVSGFLTFFIPIASLIDIVRINKGSGKPRKRPGDS